MKKALKKILVIILIILTLNNFLISSVYADDDDGIGGVIGGIIKGLLESVVGLLTYPIRIIALAAATAINALTASVAYIEGSTDPSFDMGASQSLGNVFSKSISPFDIFFNKVKILDVNFFDIETTGPEAESIVNKIRLGIATWYYVLRIIALAILLIVLVYVGIRMAITTIATDKAMYKKMLIDWVTSIIIIFLIPYIITFTLIVSNSVINAISLGVDSEEITKTYTVIGEIAFRISDVDSVAATIVYCMLVWQTFGILLSYFNRMLKVAFLIIISPLITLTYSIDKMGDGKAQALGNWLKEFVYTILIQPFHCIIYMCFINVAFNLLISNSEGNKNTMAVAVISILCVRFVKEAEKIVRKIFNFQDDGEGSLGAGLTMAAMAFSQSKNIGKSARSMVNNVKNIGSSTISGLGSIGRGVGKVGAFGASKALAGASIVAGAVKNTAINHEMKDSGGSKQQEGESKEDYDSRRAAAEQKIKDNFNSSKVGKAIGATKGKVQKLKRKVANRKTVKKMKNLERKKSEGAPVKKIKRAAGMVQRIGRLKSVYNESEVIQSAKNASKFYLSAGLGLMGASGIYGAGGKLTTSLATGGAIYGSSKEFLKNTSKTLATNIDQNLHAMGITSKKEGAEKINEILKKDTEEMSEELSSIMQEVKEALKKAGVDDKYSTSIQNKIQSAIKADPSQTQNIIKYALTSINAKGSDGKNLYETNGGSVRAVAESLANFTNESQIYETVQAAGEMGIMADTLVGEALSHYKVTDADLHTREMRNENIVNNSQYEYETLEEYNDASDDLYYEVSSMTKNQVKELESEFDKKIEELKNNSINGENNDRIKQLELQKTELISKALTKLNYDLQGEVENMKIEYEKQLNNKIEELNNQINNETSSPIDVLEARKNRMQDTLSRLHKQTEKLNNKRNKDKS